MPPKVIGPYRVLETIGSGGVGTVYRAIDRRNGDSVALKLLSTGPALDPRAARRLAREFETLYDLSHPNVVKVFDTGVYQGYPYLAMELVEGLTLRHYLSLSGDNLVSPLGLTRAIRSGRAASGSVPPDIGDSESMSMDEDSDPDGDFSPSPFDMSAYAEETPSEEIRPAPAPTGCASSPIAPTNPTPTRLCRPSTSCPTRARPRAKSRCAGRPTCPSTS